MAFVIGLTGNIGCGKSSVGAILERLGAEHLDADSVVHSLLAPRTPTAAQVVARFGRGILGPDGSVDRRALGARVFSDPALLADLERILHPPVGAELRRRIAASRREAIVVDAVKLIESGLADEADSVWVVTCSPQLQRERLIRQRGYSPQEADARIRAQTPQEEKVRRADVVIENTGTREDLEARVRAAYRAAVAVWRARERGSVS